MNSLDFPTRADLGADIDRLTGHLRGPRVLRRRLGTWARGYASGRPRAVAREELREAMRGLVTLAHANTAAALVSPPVGSAARPKVQFDDLGGYGVCLLALVNLLDSLPIPEAEIAELQRFARAVRAEQAEDIRQALLRRSRGRPL